MSSHCQSSSVWCCTTYTVKNAEGFEELVLSQENVQNEQAEWWARSQETSIAKSTVHNKLCGFVKLSGQQCIVCDTNQNRCLVLVKYSEHAILSVVHCCSICQSSVWLHIHYDQNWKENNSQPTNFCVNVQWFETHRWYLLACHHLDMSLIFFDVGVKMNGSYLWSTLLRQRSACRLFFSVWLLLR